MKYLIDLTISFNEMKPSFKPTTTKFIRYELENKNLLQK